MPWRRFITIPGYMLAWLLWLAAAPLWLVLAFVVDVVRRSNGVALRSSALITVYLSCEIAGIAASGALWLWKIFRPIEPEQWTDLHFRLEAWWGTTLFRSVVRIFGLRVEVEGDADLGRGPYILLLRHTSTADTLIASALVTWPYGVRLRYVLKREHLWDPCLDIVGNRVPNAFVDRSPDDVALEVRRVQDLAWQLGASDGVLIYPEGTRFSTLKRMRVLDRLERSGDTRMHEYAKSLAAVLPPRPGGTLGLLDATHESDVIVCAHTGFEGTASLSDIWKGALVNQVVRIHFRRVPRSEIPVDREARIAWLLEEWKKVDAWVESNRSPEVPKNAPETRASA